MKTSRNSHNTLHNIAIALSVGIAAAVPTTSQAVTVSLPAIADSIILDGSSSVNPFPGILASELGTSSAGSIWLSVVKFDLSSIVGTNVNTASFELTSIFNHSSGTFSHQVYSSSDDSWTEATVNGINRPANSTLTLLSATNISGTSQAYSWNVLAGVKGTDGLAGTNNLLTLFIRPDLSQVGNVFGPHFNDRSNTSGVPRLLLDVSPVPEPTTLTLFAIGIVSVARRTLKVSKEASRS